MSRKWSERALEEVTNKIVTLLKSKNRHFSASGITQMLSPNSCKRVKRSLSPRAVSKLMKVIVGHNGILSKLNDDGYYDYWYDEDMERLHSIKDTGVMLNG